MNPDLTKRIEEIKKRQRDRAESADMWNLGEVPRTYSDIKFLLDLVESIRAEALREAVALASEPIDTLGWGSASGGVAQKVIVEKLRALITQPPNYEAAAKRATERD